MIDIVTKLRARIEELEGALRSAQLTWLPIDHRPLATGRYIVAHRGHAEIISFLSPNDADWQSHTRLGWQKDPAAFRATHCALLPDVPESK